MGIASTSLKLRDRIFNSGQRRLEEMLALNIEGQAAIASQGQYKVCSK